MTAVEGQATYFLEDLRVLGIRADVGSDAEENEAFWRVTYYDPDEELGSDNPRVLIGSLHAHGPEGAATVSVGSLITAASSELPSDHEALSEVIASSSAVETLYDFARVNLRGILGTIDVDISLPYKSPKPEIAYGDAPEAVEANDDQAGED